MQRYISSLLLPNTLQTPSANVANGSNWAAVSDAALDQQNLLNDDNLGAMRSSRGWTVTQQMLVRLGESVCMAVVCWLSLARVFGGFARHFSVLNNATLFGIVMQCGFVAKSSLIKKS